MGVPGDRDGLGVIPDERNDQFPVCRGCKREGAVRTCRGTDMLALDHDCGSGAPAASVTVPETCLFWADTYNPHTKTAINDSTIFLTISVNFKLILK